MQKLRLPAPAKLNLMLRIVGRREDGYHLLQSVFQFIDRCDWITLGARSDGVINLENELPGVPAPTDLTVRAAELLRASAGKTALGVDIHIDKNLPMGGGLGGGSSDAATVLLGLNHLWNLDLSIDTLAQLGLSLGADVPVFVRGRSAWAEGVGEILTPIDNLPEPWYVVVVPECHVATGVIFNSPNLTRNSKPITMRDFVLGDRANDCLSVVEAVYPVVLDAMSSLRRLADEPRLTGTGACIFAEFTDLSQAQDTVQHLSEQKLQAFVAKGQNISMLHKQLFFAP